MPTVTASGKRRRRLHLRIRSVPTIPTHNHGCKQRHRRGCLQVRGFVVDAIAYISTCSVGRDNPVPEIVCIVQATFCILPWTVCADEL